MPKLPIIPKYANKAQVTDAEYREWFEEQKRLRNRQTEIEESTENTLEDNSREDSNGDGLFISDDDINDLFPEEFP